MEVPQWDPKFNYLSYGGFKCLNPYSNGSTTMGCFEQHLYLGLRCVLILILMEVPQWVCGSFQDNEKFL